MSDLHATMSFNPDWDGPRIAPRPAADSRRALTPHRRTRLKAPLTTSATIASHGWHVEDKGFQFPRRDAGICYGSRDDVTFRCWNPVAVSIERVPYRVRDLKIWLPRRIVYTL